MRTADIADSYAICRTNKRRQHGLSQQVRADVAGSSSSLVVMSLDTAPCPR
jgi:hypothetical protein